MPKERSGWMKRAYSIRNKDDVHEIYAGWADSYDEDVLGEYGYVAPGLAAKALSGVLQEKDAVILDAGCGTGIVGMELGKLGYGVIDGIDISPAMLVKAREKGVYRHLEAADMTEDLAFMDNHFDAAISIGVFAMGHVGPEALPELLRIVKPGGIVCLTVNELVYDDRDYESHFTQLENDGLAEMLSLGETDYVRETGVKGYLALMRVR